MALYLTPAAIGYLTQLILSTLISGYLWASARRPNRPRHAWLLTGFFSAFSGFLAALFLEASLLPTPRICIVLTLNPLLGTALVCLLQFAYHFPVPSPALRREARLALLVSGLYTLCETAFAIYRFIRLQAGEYIYRADWADTVLLLFFLWSPWAFARQLARLIPPPAARQTARQWLQRWLTSAHPDFLLAHSIQSIRAFILIFFCVAGLNVFNILRTYYLLPDFLANAGLSIGILIALFAFAAGYFNALPETTSFMVKLAGVTLTTLLAVMGVAGWIIAPRYQAQYHANLPEGRALRFTPNASGGYDIVEIPFAFENDLGENLRLDDGIHQPCSLPLDFPFPFFTHAYAQVFACNDGTVAMGQALPYRSYQYRYGAGAPLILALLSDLDPTISAGGVFARQEADRLLITWDRLRGFRRPDEEYTFQTVLYADGRFDLRYLDLPANPVFYPNDDPGASVWAIGVTPGNLSGAVPQRVAFSQDATSWQSGPAGMVQDYVIEFRQHLNDLLAPLAGLILAASATTLAGLPPLFYSSLVRPLNVLLAGVRRAEAGDYNLDMPVRAMDEIGFLTRAFNRLALELGEMIHKLEDRVAERTAELDAANLQLRAEMFESEQAQATVIAQQRRLAAFDERERLSRDLHDGLGQSMGYINVQAQAVETLLSAGKTDAARLNLQQLAQTARAVHDDVRRHILGLRASEETPSLQAIGSPQGFFETLRAYLAQFQERYGLATHLWLPEEAIADLFAPAVEEQALRIVQEALTNAGKHAQARRVDVAIRLLGDQAQIEVTDDGVGFDPNPPAPVSRPANGDPGHFGLDILHERAGQVGGRLEVRSAPGQGTRVTVTLPRILLAAGGEADAGIRGLRVLLADDSPLFLDGLRNLLLARGVTVVGTAPDGRQAIDKARLLHPDVVVLDLNMPGCNGLEATRAIKTDLPDIKVVILTVSEDEALLFEAIQSGASGYLLKSLEANQFTALLTGVLRGEAALSPGMAERVLAEFARRSEQLANKPSVVPASADEALTPRQWQILQQVAQGHTYKEIGAALGISEKAIKYHMGQIMARLNVDNRAQAIAYALQREGRQ